MESVKSKTAWLSSSPDPASASCAALFNYGVAQRLLAVLPRTAVGGRRRVYANGNETRPGTSKEKQENGAHACCTKILRRDWE